MKSRQKLKDYYHMKMYNNNPKFIRLHIKYKQMYRNFINAAKAYDLEKQIKCEKNIDKNVWTEINKFRGMRKHFIKSTYN